MNKILLICIIVITGIWFAFRFDFDTYIMPPSALLPDGGRYYGKVKDGLFTGEGKIIWTNGSSYHGNFEKGLFSGLGKLVKSSGNTYEGQFVDGVLTGQGQLKTNDGDLYQGQFKNYYFDGYGRWEFDQGSSYVGNFKKNRYHDAGTLIIKDGDSYIGNFKNGQYHGEGSVKYSNGNSYRGQFINNDLHGHGLYKTSNGDRYEGDFVKSQFTGIGIFEDASENRYEGEFKDWQFNGQGKYISTEGDGYTGEFEQGKMSGKGIFKRKDGLIYTGPFKDGVYHGKGDLLTAQGDRYQGEFKYGSYNGLGVLTYAAPKDGQTMLVGKWRYGKYIGDGTGPDPREANTEQALYNQNQLVQATIDSLLQTENDKINMYFVGIGGDGKQDVFHKEVNTIQNLFDQSFGTLGRSAMIVNNPGTVDSIPLATTTAIEQVLKGLSKKMNPEKDILFIYLTSHGSNDHEFVLDQDGLAIPNLPAKRLAEIVNKLPVKWKVITISACYSGGFIPKLENDNSLIITAAAHDRQSFGCSDDADMTYFGRAFFQDALSESDSFVAAFEKAKKLVSEREKEHISGDKNKHSRPQISRPKAITNYLKKWRAQLEPIPQLHDRSNSTTLSKTVSQVSSE